MKYKTYFGRYPEEYGIWLIYLLVFISILGSLGLIGCTKSPGTFDAKVTRVWYMQYSPSNGVDIYSEKYGNMTISDSPFYERVRIGDPVTVACSRMVGIFSPSDCTILEKK